VWRKPWQLRAMFCCAAARRVGGTLITVGRKTSSLSIVRSRRRTAVRSLSASPRSKGSDIAGGERDRRVLAQWDVVVDPFCSVRARLGCSVAVRPLDPLAFPEASRASVVVYGSSLARPGDLQHVNVHYDGHNKELSIVADGVTSDMSVELTTSVKSSK